MLESAKRSVDVLSVLNSIPGCHLILFPNAPVFTIVGATEDYLTTTYLKREEAIGKGVFEAHTDNPDNPHATGVKNLSASLHMVLAQKKEHRMDNQRYDVYNPATGQFEFKVWSPSNKPVFDEVGEVQYIIHTVEDITEKVRLQEETKIADKKLGESELRFRQMVEQAPIAILLSRGENVIIENVNESMLHFIGKTSPEEVIGKKMVDVLPELKDQHALQVVLNVQKTGVPYRGDEQPVDLLVNGILKRHYFNLSYTPFIEDGEVTGVLYVAVDVTQLVETRKRVLESEAKYQSLFYSMDQGFCVIEMIFDQNDKPIDYQFIEVNPVFEQQTGLSGAVGKTARDLVPDLEQRWFDLYGNIAIRGESIRFLERSEAMNKWFDVFAYSMSEEKKGRVALLFRDVTDQKNAEAAIKQSEKNLRNTIMQAPFAMCIFRGNDFVIEVANPSMFKFWGRPGDEVMNKPIFTAIPEARNQGYEEIMTSVLQTGEAISARELTVRLPRNGIAQQVYIDFSFTPIQELDGTITGILAVAMDITEQVMARRRIELSEAELQKRVLERTKQLETLNQELQRSNRYLADFAHAASHDMKEPLRKIRTFGDRLKQTMGSRMEENETRMLERMEAAAKRMQNLVDDLLEFSHVSNTSQDNKDVDLKEKVQKVLIDLELQIEEKNAQVVIGQLPVIKGFPRQLEQLFHNLIGNALKYSKTSETPRIIIRSREIKGNEAPLQLPDDVIDRKFHLIEIEDNGIGFEQQYAEKIFNIFQRLHGKAEYSGTGIGLSIAKKVVENHQGYIWAEGEEGVGATFKVMLPAW